MTFKPDALWSFETAQFFVGFYAEPEDMDPADSFEFPEDIEAVRSGAVEWFHAVVRVYHKRGANRWEWVVIGSDNLGGCAYGTIREFYESHRDPDPLNRNSSITRAARGANVSICHYFPEMVRLALKEARDELRRLQSVRVREYA